MTFPVCSIILVRFLPLLVSDWRSFALKNEFVFSIEKAKPFISKNFLSSFPLNNIFFSWRGIFRRCASVSLAPRRHPCGGQHKELELAVKRKARHATPDASRFWGSKTHKNGSLPLLGSELRSLSLKNGVRFRRRSFIFKNILASLVLNNISYHWRGVFVGEGPAFSALPPPLASMTSLFITTILGYHKSRVK
jgi:hypothetical protein